MAKTATITMRVKPAIKQRLRALAKITERSEAYLAQQAIAEYLDLNEWQVKEIRRRLTAARGGEPGVPHEEVEAWVKSWGTGREVLKPRPRS